MPTTDTLEALVRPILHEATFEDIPTSAGHQEFERSQARIAASFCRGNAAGKWWIQPDHNVAVMRR